MPYNLFSAKETQLSVEKKISDALDLLVDVNETDKNTFLQLLTARMKDFQSELEKNKESPSEKQLILEQYNRFAKTLNLCISQPFKTSRHVYSYHTFKYIPVGIDDLEKPNAITQTLLGAAFGLGLVLLVAAIPAFFFNPIAGAVLIAAAFTCLLPSILYFLTPESKDTSVKKEEERLIFQEAAKLILPDLIFDNTARSRAPTK